MTTTKTFGNGNQTIAEGSDEIIAVGNGNDTITIGSQDALTVGNGNNTVTAGSSDTISLGNGNDVVTAGSGAAITVGNGNNTVSAGDGSSVAAGNGNDKITVGNNSRISVGNGNQTLTAGSNSSISAGDGNITISAGNGDTIAVGNGNDAITMGAGNTVTLGKGNDTLVVGASRRPSLSAPATLSVSEDGSIALPIAVAVSAVSFGHDTITGFSSSNDRLSFTTSQFASFTDVMNHAAQVGQDTVITLDAADTITLKGVARSSLTAKDFVFTTPGPADAVSITLSGIPSDVKLSDGGGPLTVTNGSITLTQAQLAGLTLTAGEVTSATLMLTAINLSTGASASQTIALSVNPVAPTLAITNQNLSVSEDGAVPLGISEMPFDPRDTVSITISGVPTDAHLSAGINNGGGTWTLTPAQLAGLTLTAGEVTSANLTVTATNTQGATASTSKSIALSVTPVAPTLAITNQSLSVNEDGAVPLGISEMPFDPRDTVSITISGVPTDAHLSTGINNGGGIWTLTPAQLAGLTLTAGEVTSANLTVTATNTQGATASTSKSIALSVNPVAPSLAIANQSLSVSEDGIVPLGISEMPFDPRDTVSITISGVPTDATLSTGINNGGGTWTLTPGQLSGLTLTAGEVTSANLTVTATNTQGATASTSKSIALSVTPVAPSLAIANQSLSVSEDGIVPLGISEMPFDPRDTVSITISGVPADATLSTGINNGGGTWTLTPSQLSGLTLTAGEVASANLTVTATNTQGATASTSKSIALSVNPVAPSLAIANQSLSVSEDGIVPLGISEMPFDPRDTVSITISGVPTDATLSTGINNGGGTWTLTPGQLSGLTLTAGEVTSANLTVTATNTQGATASTSRSIALSVNPVAPSLTIANQSLSVSEDGIVPLGISEMPFDPRDTVSITISGVPADATLSAGINNGGGIWTLTPTQLSGLALTAGEVTSANLTVTATNTEGATASTSKSIALSVTPVAPMLSAPASLSVNAGNSVMLDIAETPFDPRDTVSITISGVPADATLSAGTNNGNGSWTLAPSQLAGLTLNAGNATAATLTVTATNTQGATASTTDQIALTVSPANYTISLSAPGVVFFGLSDTGVAAGNSGYTHATQVGFFTNTTDTTSGFLDSTAAGPVNLPSLLVEGISSNGNFVIANSAIYSNGTVTNLPTGFGGFAINDSGVATGTDGSSGFILDGGVSTLFTVPGADTTFPFAINDSNEIAGFYTKNKVDFAFSDVGGNITTLTPAGATSSQADAVNASGEVAGFYTDASGTHGFTDIGGAFTTLNAPGATSTYALSVNSSGEVAGYYVKGGNDFGFVYDNGVYTTFTAPGAAGTVVYSINASGDIAGFAGTAGSDAAGYTGISGFIASTGPVITTPLINGTAQEGQVLVASATSGPDDAVTYAWFSSADGFTNPIGTGSIYTVQEGDETHQIEVKATATGPDGVTASATSAPTSPVADQAPSVSVPLIDGTPEVGQTLTASAVALPDDVLTYAWFSSADNFANPIGTGSTYVVKAGDEGFTLEATATATNDDDITASETSAATTAVAGAPPVPPGSQEALINFAGGAAGANPDAGLIADGTGDLFGTTAGGGAKGDGTAFEIVNNGTVANPSYASTPVTLVSFNGTNGAIPVAGLSFDTNGNLFGTTQQGGQFGGGTVFEIELDPSFSRLASFNPTTMGVPVGGVTVDGRGNLLGTLQSVIGSTVKTTVFELINNGTVTAPSYSGAVTLLASLTGGPSGGLIADANGDLFGTAGSTVFELVNNGTAAAPSYATSLTTLVSLGSTPLGLVLDANGDLFGATNTGGQFNDGTVFEIVNTGTVDAPSYAASATTLASFDGTDGRSPSGSLSVDARGDLFGTTALGGQFGDGTVFEIVNNGTVAAPSYGSEPVTLLSFDGSDGATPRGSLSFDADGDLLGTTAAGGTNGDGMAFEITNLGLVGDLTEDENVDGAGNLVATGTLASASPFETTVAGAPGNLGSLVVGTDGSYTYTVADSAVQFLGADATKTDTFTVTTADGAQQPVSFVIHGTNDPAVIGDPTAADVTVNANVDGADDLVATGTIAVSDADQGQSSFQTTVTAAAGDLGSLVLAADGSYTYTVDNNAVQFLGAGDTQVDSFTITSFDGTQKQVSFTIHGTPVAPSLQTLANLDIPVVSTVDPVFGSGVVADANGDLFGTVQAASGSPIFEIVNNGTVDAPSYGSVQRVPVPPSLAGANVSFGTLAKDSNGNLFGTTFNGGNGNGTVFEIKTDGTVVKLPSPLGGFGNAASILVDAAGNLLVTTTQNFETGPGGVFEIVNTGTVADPVYSAGLGLVTTVQSEPDIGLIADANGNLFGETIFGGTAQAGSVFEIVNTGTAAAPSYAHSATTLASFTDDAFPAGGLVLDAKGDLFGVTENTVFELVNNGTAAAPSYASSPTTLVTFNGSNGGGSEAGLLIDGNGDLFGTTSTTVFEVVNNGTADAPSYATEPTTLGRFDSGTGGPNRLTFDANGNLLGMTELGGANGDGTVFEVTNLGVFGDLTEDVDVDAAGNLVKTGTLTSAVPFQTTVVAAPGNLGSLVVAADGSYTYTIADSAVQFLGANDSQLDSFTVSTVDGTTKPVSFVIHGTNDPAVIGDPTDTDVTANLNVDGAGNLVAAGTIAVSDPDQNQATFRTTVTGAKGNLGSLVLAADGSYTYSVDNNAVQYLGVNDTQVDTFTVTSFDGTQKQVSFTIHGSAAAPSVQTLASLGGGSLGGNPIAGLVADAKGDLFGTTSAGGTSPVFELVNNGTVAAPSYAGAIPVPLSGDGAPRSREPGDESLGSLSSDSNGNLFGTTFDGGSSGDGTVFEIKSDGSFVTLADLADNFAGSPTSIFVDAGGNLIITTGAQANVPGVSNFGSVLEIVNNGTVADPSYLRTIPGSPPIPATAGLRFVGFLDGPSSGLIADANGDLFGETEVEAESTLDGRGTVFEIVNTGTAAAPSYGKTSTLAGFDGGPLPSGGLTFDAKGDLFGTTSFGGEFSGGTVFEIVNNGTVAAPSYASSATTLASLAGGSPNGGLIVDADGDLFGTTDTTVFEIVNKGTVADASYSSDPVILAKPSGSQAGLIADANGDLFGTTTTGGTNGAGTVFEITNSHFVAPDPATIADGASFEIASASADAVTFAGGSGTLQLDQSQGFVGTIAGFGGEDQIDLGDISFGAGTTLGFVGNNGNTLGVLTVSDGTHTANIELLGQYTASSFAMASDNHGGTLITDPPPASSQPPLTQPHA